MMLHERSNIAASVVQHLLFNFQGEMSRTHSLWVKKAKQNRNLELGYHTF